MSSASQSVAPINWATESDDDLILYMMLKADDKKNAEKAFSEFHRRYADYLYKVLWAKEGRNFGKEGIEDLVNNTLLQAYYRAETYKSKGIKGWLGAIAKNEIINYFRGLNTNEIPLDENRLQADENDAPEDRSLIDLKYQEAIESLNEKEREVIRIANLYFRMDREHQHTPHEILKEFCERYGTTPTNFRKIKERATKKIKDRLIAGGDKNEIRRQR